MAYIRADRHDARSLKRFSSGSTERRQITLAATCRMASEELW